MKLQTDTITVGTEVKSLLDWWIEGKITVQELISKCNNLIEKEVLAYGTTKSNEK